MLSTFIAVTLAAAPASGREQVEAMQSARVAYRDCAVSEMIRLGTGNQETAETLLRAVAFKCQPQWQAFVDSWPDASGVAIAVRAKRDITDGTRVRVENEAIAALLDARARR